MKAYKNLDSITINRIWQRLKNLEKTVAYFEENGVNTSFNVYYQVDTGVSHVEQYASGQVIIYPTTFTPTKDGYTFVGWKTSNVANSDVLTADNESSTMHTEDVILYAVFRKSYTVSYNGNDSTSGSVASQTVYEYYNNGNVGNATVTLAANGFTRTDATFSKWAINSTSGTQYSAGASVTITANTTFYAKWLVATTKSGSISENGTFQNGYSTTKSISFGVTFASAPTVTKSYSGSGHWANHSAGGGCSVSDVTTTGFKFKIYENTNTGNNYNYQVTWSWTATGNVLV